MGLCIFVSGFNKEGLISVRVMEKKRFEKTCSSADQKTFCIYRVLEIMLQNAEIYLSHFNAFEGRFISGRGGGGLMTGCLFITKRVAYNWQFTVHTMYRLVSYIENIRY